MNMSSYSCCAPDKQEYRNVSSLSSLLKLVGEESRLKILCILRQGQHCVCEIEKHVQLSQSLISHHLKDLKAAGLIIDEKKGLSVYYSLTEAGKRIVNSLFNLEGGNI
jgi:ArsR family transcriptional regulator, arsenate/arsenite/antimonite-responsive transcriptional repressor